MVKLKIRFLFLLLLSTLACVACSPQKIKGNPPFVSISSMTAMEQSLSADFDIRNINDVHMTIDSIDINIRVRDIEVTRYVSDFNLTIDPNTTEEVSVEKLPDEFARELLDSLESGDVSSLPFSLEGRVHTAEDGFMPFKHEGHLYPVPGRPGQFRSASSRTRERP
jgi:LEA14-like dessication related protein